MAVVRCPDCRTEVELPDVTKPGKKYLCPDCNSRLPLPAEAPARRPSKPARAAEDEEDDRPARKSRPRRDEDEDEPPPPKSRKRREEDDEDEDDRPSRRRKSKAADDGESAFWKSRTGKLVGGLGFLLLGAVVLALAFTLDSRKFRGIGLGVICVLLGLFSIGSALFASSDSTDDEDEDEDEDDED